MAVWIEWAFRTLLILLVAGNLFWIKRWIQRVEEWQRNHDKRVEIDVKEQLKAGGLVTRDLWFEFCQGVRDKCPILLLTSWKEAISNEGGVMTRKDWDEERGKDEERLIKGIERLFSEHDGKVEAIVGGLKQTIEANAGKMDLVIKRQNEVVQRIDRLYEKGVG